MKKYLINAKTMLVAYGINYQINQDGKKTPLSSSLRAMEKEINFISEEYRNDMINEMSSIVSNTLEKLEYTSTNITWVFIQDIDTGK